MPPTSPETSSAKSNNARKGTAEAASQAAASAFASTSNLQFSDSLEVPPEQQGRRRLVDSYVLLRAQLVPDPDQPRKEFDEQEMTDLTNSIRARGIKQPQNVRWNAELSKYMVIDGGRRLEAASRLNLPELPCWMQRGDQKDVLIDQIVHNWQRSDLRPYETADALARLRDEFDMTQKAMVEVTGKSKSEISKLLALHDRVAPEVKTLVRSDKDSRMTKRHLYQISRLGHDEQKEVVAEIQRDQLSAEDTEKLVQAHAGIPSAKPTRKKVKGISFRQKRFHTTVADVLVTFRKVNFDDNDLRQVIHELRRLVDRGEV